MTLLQEFYPMPVDQDLSYGVFTSQTLINVLVWENWQLRALSVADINRGYVLAPTPFSRQIVDYVIRNKDKILQVENQYIYFLRKDNPSQFWPPPVDLPEDLSDNLPLPRLYGKVIIESISTKDLLSLGARGAGSVTNQERGSISAKPNTTLQQEQVSFYGVGGVIDPNIPFSSTHGIPKDNNPFVLSFGEDSDELLLIGRDTDVSFFASADNSQFVDWSYNRGTTFRNRVITNSVPFPRPTRDAGLNTWQRFAKETFSANTENHILVFTVRLRWRGRDATLSTNFSIPFRLCPILRVRLGDKQYQIYLGDIGPHNARPVSNTLPRLRDQLFRWPMVIPASRGYQDFTLDIMFPEIPEEDWRRYYWWVESLSLVGYSLRSPKSLIKEHLIWEDMIVWAQGPPTASIAGTDVRVPKGSEYKDKDLLISIPDEWSFSDGFDYLRTSDPVWISIDILLRSGIPLSDIDWVSAVKTSKLVDEPVGLVVDDVSDTFDELRIKPVFVNGLWRFSSETIKTIQLSQMQTLPKISVLKPEAPPRSIGVPYKPMKFIEVTRESNQPGYQTIHVVDTLNESEAIKEGRRYLWPETTTTLQVNLSTDVVVLVNDFIIIPQSTRQWKVESIKRTSTAQQIITSWIDPDRERYIETGIEPTVGDFIDDWGFLDLHGFVDA